MKSKVCGESRWCGHKNRTFNASFKHAVRGIFVAVLLEANIRRQLLLLFFALVLAVLLGLSAQQILLIITIAGLVLTAELFNSSLEALADGLHPDYNECIERAKDIAAGAVLVISAIALIIGLVVIGPPLWQVILLVVG